MSAERDPTPEEQAATDKFFMSHFITEPSSDIRQAVEAAAREINPMFGWYRNTDDSISRRAPTDEELAAIILRHVGPVVGGLKRERDALLGIFSDHESPCDSVSKANARWNDLRARLETVLTARDAFQGDCEILRACLAAAEAKLAAWDDLYSNGPTRTQVEAKLKENNL